MPTRVMLTIEKVLPDEDGVRQMEELRTFLGARGWDVLAEGGGPTEEAPLEMALPPRPALVPPPPPAYLDRCPHCKGGGRVAGAGTCGLCNGTGKVPAGVRHSGRCCS